MAAPPISKALMDYLQATFPDKLPTNMPGPGQVEVLIGNQQVIRHLQAQHLAQTKTVLVGPEGTT